MLLFKNVYIFFTKILLQSFTIILIFKLKTWKKNTFLRKSENIVPYYTRNIFSNYLYYYFHELENTATKYYNIQTK